MARVVFCLNDVNLGTGSMAAWYVHFQMRLGSLIPGYVQSEQSPYTLETQQNLSSATTP